MTGAGTIHQLNAQVKNPEQEEQADIEVIDPRHPLFGRHFPLISVSSQPHTPGYVYVSYHQTIVLRIPKPATTLAPSRPSSPTKLTHGAVQELIAVAEACEVLCPLIRAPSGNACPASYKIASRTTSCPS